jgi:glycosyltransferase involved in cell wall biosynthesis
LKVFYTWGESVMKDKYDPGFGRVVKWDIPLLDGYDYQFLDNRARKPGSHHFRGIDNPFIIGDINSWQPDEVLVIGWNFQSHLKALRYYNGRIPVLFRGDSTLLDGTGSIRSLIKQQLLRYVYHHVDIALYTGTHNKSYFQKAGMKEEQLLWAPHVVDNEFFRDPDGQLERQAQEWRQSLGIGTDSVAFVFAGKLEKKKSPFLLLEAFKSTDFPVDCHLIIVGNGELEARLKDQAGGYHIHFLDFQNQSVMPLIYRLGDAFVLPSEGPGESWGLAINEAMACARPVVASTRCGGSIDLIRDGVNGFLFESGNALQLKEELLSMSKNRQMLRKMGMAAFEHIQQFSLVRTAEMIEQAVIAEKRTGKG